MAEGDKFRILIVDDVARNTRELAKVVTVRSGH